MIIVDLNVVTDEKFEELNKSMILDRYGWGCDNCGRGYPMEHHTGKLCPSCGSEMYHYYQSSCQKAIGNA